MLLCNRREGIVELVDKTYKRTLLYISCHFISGHFVKSPRNAQVTSAEELGTMSKNNLRGIALEIKPTLGIHSLSLHCLLYIVWAALMDLLGFRECALKKFHQRNCVLIL